MELNTKTNKWESDYWHPAVTADAVVFGFDIEEGHMSVLLIERGIEPFKGSWALPGGFITKEDKTAKDAIIRELKEETNVEGLNPIEFKTFSDEHRDPRERVITIAFYALVDQNKYNMIKGGDDARKAKWFPINSLPKLAFDHQDIIDAAMERLQRDIHFEPIGFHLLDEEFTLPQLHNIYKTILQPSYEKREERKTDEETIKRLKAEVEAQEKKNDILNDRRNFLKKMLKEGYIKDTGRKVTGVPNRPPSLYTFDEKAFAEDKAKMRTKL